MSNTTSKLRGVPCYQHDSYHSDCSDCYHPAPVAPSRSAAPYALFGTILDMDELDDGAKLAKLKKLREEIERAVEGIQ